MEVIYCIHLLCPIFIVTQPSLGREYGAQYQELDCCSIKSAFISYLPYVISPSEMDFNAK